MAASLLPPCGSDNTSSTMKCVIASFDISISKLLAFDCQPRCSVSSTRGQVLTCHKDIDGSGSVFPDLWACGHVVHLRIGRIFKLLKHVSSFSRLHNLLSFLDRPRHSLYRSEGEIAALSLENSRCSHFAMRNHICNIYTYTYTYASSKSYHPQCLGILEEPRHTSLPFVSTSSAPNAFSKMRRSVDILSGIVRMSL